MSNDTSFIIKEKLQVLSSSGTRHKPHSSVTTHFPSLMMHQCSPLIPNPLSRAHLELNPPLSSVRLRLPDNF